MSILHDKWIFEYRSSKGYGCVGMPDGSSISIDDSGNVVKRYYAVGVEKPRRQRLLAKQPELAQKISAIINQHLEELKAIPDELNNGTLDGSYDSFQFEEKRIGAWQIRRADPAEVQQENPQYYEKYKDNIAHENLVLEIYDEIAVEINKAVVGARMEIR